VTDTTDIGGNIAPVVPIKSTKPKAPAKKDDLGLADVPFRGGENPEGAVVAYEQSAGHWASWNQTRSEEGVLGLDGIIIELAYWNGAKPTKAGLLKLAAVATLAAEVAE
jgi:hypothetical protein